MFKTQIKKVLLMVVAAVAMFIGVSEVSAKAPKFNKQKSVVKTVKGPKLSAGVYHLFPCKINPNYPCCWVPSNGCILIVVKANLQEFTPGEAIGPALNTRPSSDPAWIWEADLPTGDMLRWDVK